MGDTFDHTIGLLGTGFDAAAVLLATTALVRTGHPLLRRRTTTAPGTRGTSAAPLAPSTRGTSAAPTAPGTHGTSAAPTAPTAPGSPTSPGARASVPDPSPLTAASAVLSLLSSFALAAPGAGPAAEQGSLWKLATTALLLPLIAAVARWSRPRELRPTVALAALAIALWPLPLAHASSFLEGVGIATFWLLPALAALASGTHFRRQEHLRRRAVTEARHDQRRQLSRDLHDFVAHDISGIVVQAQAARFVAATDPAQAVLALERIEKAGLNALSAMDRTLDMLDPTPRPAGATAALPTVAQLPALTADFTAAGPTPAHLHMPLELPESLPRETGAAAYRIAVEALTNIRRHAPAATRADITLTPGPTALELRITNDTGPHRTVRTARPRARPRRYGGRGIPALTELTHALGGTLTTGPHPTGWHLTAVLPLKPPSPAQPQTPQPPHPEPK
ncbi:histidine kinase [Streptomyces sp. NPDC048442]|uniref:sensor histidine kinase n=1 Tax=Streptomyces sp. NPDC048442 TaxID=3154823 RepID=UPI003448B2E0